MNKISSSDRSALIRLASSLSAGDQTRKAILAGLQKVSGGESPEKISEKILSSFGDVSALEKKFPGIKKKLQAPLKKMLSSGATLGDDEIALISEGEAGKMFSGVPGYSELEKALEVLL